MVMPFSFSRSIESIRRSSEDSCWLARKVPDCLSRQSTKVVLPWSTCAMIATFRMSIKLFRGVVGRSLYARSMTAARQVEAASCRCHSLAMRKRSVTIDGHRTSVSLEDAFWAELSAIAEQRGLSLNALVAEIDHGRSPGNLSSALRLFVLDELRKRTISRA